jgi:hypothetical protein
VPAVIGTRLTVAGEGAAGSVPHTGWPARAARLAGPPGSVADCLGRTGMRAGSGSPVVAGGWLWGPGQGNRLRLTGPDGEVFIRAGQGRLMAALAVVRGPGFRSRVSLRCQVPRLVPGRPGYAWSMAQPPPGRRFAYLAGSPRVPGTVILAWPYTRSSLSSSLRNCGSQAQHSG